MNEQLMALWTLRTKRCLISRPEATAPFWVRIIDGDRSSANAFNTHDQATQFAVNALHASTTAERADS
jgi:hypothetical protein